jgi:hypothetical protein
MQIVLVILTACVILIIDAMWIRADQIALAMCSVAEEAIVNAMLTALVMPIVHAIQIQDVLIVLVMQTVIVIQIILVIRIVIVMQIAVVM